jgi:hypothetical protein
LARRLEQEKKFLNISYLISSIPTARKAHNIGNRKKVHLDRSLRQLMLAVSVNRTLVNYGKRHFCRKHGVVINKTHINDCDCLSRNLSKPVTHYNALLETTSIYDLTSEELEEMVEHYE